MEKQNKMIKLYQEYHEIQTKKYLFCLYENKCKLRNYDGYFKNSIIDYFFVSSAFQTPKNKHTSRVAHFLLLFSLPLLRINIYIAPLYIAPYTFNNNSIIIKFLPQFL